MDRPQWRFRHGAPLYPYRWRPTDFVVRLCYHTLDVDAEDADGFFKITGNLLEEAAARELVSAAQWRRNHRVEMAQRQRIQRTAALVEYYLKIKEWRRRLRLASADLDWNFEPYRQAYAKQKAEQAAAKAEAESQAATEAAEAQSSFENECPTCGWLLRLDMTFSDGKSWYCGRCGFVRAVEQGEKVDA